MNKNIRTVLALTLLMVLPLLFYAVLQIRSLAQDEELANKIYKEQMETILFSLNQSAEEKMAHWVRRLAAEQQTVAQNAADLILENESVQLLVLRKESTRETHVLVNDYVQIDAAVEKKIHNWYSGKETLLQQLTEYLDAGFQKIQPAENWPLIPELDSSQSVMTVMLYDRHLDLHNALIVLHPRYWVETMLGQSMQELAEDDRRLSVIKHQDNRERSQVIYATEPFDFKSDYTESPLWIFSDTYLTIQSKGKSYAQLLRSRSQRNLFVLLSSLLIMITGTVLIIRNIRNTIKVAQLKSDFVRNVSHEIRTPLSLIKMYSETLMLNRLPSAEKRQHYYEIIHFESGRLTYLVNNILDFSKIEANRKTYELEETELNRLVERVYSEYLYTFSKNKVVHNLILHSEELPVMADPQAFNEALSNLIENAIKFSEEDKFVLLKTYANGNFACLEIKDQGIGIPKNVQHQIFDKFYRVEDVLTQKTRGTGLGLSLVKHIMNAHQGEVLIHSAINKGSTFTLKIPLKQKKA